MKLLTLICCIIRDRNILEDTGYVRDKVMELYICLWET